MRLLSPKATQEKLGLSRSGLLYAELRGRIKVIRTGDGRRVFDAREVERVAAERAKRGQK
jgi:predicted site-specific integrase-resolvase